VRSGTHLPHPNLRSRQVQSAEWSFARPQRVWVDGHFWLAAKHVKITVLPADFRLLI
jgi:hypothetical protein